MVYEWKNGSRISADAQASGELFKRLSETEEGLTARTLLEANIPEDAPLHNEYEWDDTKAADEWRMHQSRHFINSIVISVSSDNDEETKQIRQFHITTEKGVYEPLEVILNEKTKRDALLSSALSDLRAFKAKYNALRELKPVFNAIDIVEKAGGNE